MKKIAFIVLLITTALTFSCNKNSKVQTQISGTLMTNGTNDPVLLSTELPNPEVILFHNVFHSGGIIAGETVAQEVTRTTVDNNAHYSFDVELYEEDEYFVGFEGLDESIYHNPTEWFPENVKENPVIPGTNNTIHLKASAFSFVRPRFINTNTDPNNNDVFKYIGGGIGTPGSPQWNFTGPYDSIMPWVYETWSGESSYNGLKHQVEGKLTRNGVTIDTVIPYSVPPFDTSIVIIRY